MIILKDGARPHVRGQLILRQTDFLPLKIARLFDPVRTHINGRMTKCPRDEGGHPDIRAIFLRGLYREARQRQFTDIEFGLPEGAKENLFRRQRHAGRLDAIDLDCPVDQRPRAVVGADGDGKIEFGHGNPAGRQNCRNVICEMLRRRYSTPRFCNFSSGVTSTAWACPVIFTGPRQSLMQGFGFQKTFSVFSRSSS